MPSALLMGRRDLATRRGNQRGGCKTESLIRRKTLTIPRGTTRMPIVGSEGAQSSADDDKENKPPN